MYNDRTNTGSADENPINHEARRVLHIQPVSADVFGGIYPRHDDFTIDTVESTASELSFSSESPDSDSTVTYIPKSANTSEPIVELPLTPSKDGDRNRTCADETLTPCTIGAALEKSGTVLMQRSQGNRLPKQLEDMQALMNNDDELVVVKQPSIPPMASQPAFNKDVMRGFLEHTETMFNLMHESLDNSDQPEIGIEKTKSGKTDADGFLTKKEINQDNPLPQAGGENSENEFVGCFSRNEDMALYKRTIPEEQKRSHPRKSIDALIAHHADCLAEADEATNPTIHVRHGKNDQLLAWLKFSDQSSAMLKTSSPATESASTPEELNQTILDRYRKLITTPDEMISMQTQVTATGDSKLMPQELREASEHKYKPRPETLNSLANSTSSFGLTNDPQCGMILQGSSKNWKNCPKALHAAELVTHVRLLIEEYVLLNISASSTVIKYLSYVLSDVEQCSIVKIDEQFQRASLIEKIKRVLDDLLMPQEGENPLQIVNQLRVTIEEIKMYPIKLQTISNGEDAWEKISSVLEKLACEVNHEVENPETFLEALQFGLNCIPKQTHISSETSETKSITVDPSAHSQPTSTSVFGIDRYEPPSVSFCRPYSCFVEWIIWHIWSAFVWIKDQLCIFWNFLLAPPPPILGVPSVSFRETVSVDESTVPELRVERDHLNRAMNVFRIVLQKAPTSMQDSEDGRRSVNVRSMEMFTQLLHHAGSIEMKHSDSRHKIHLELNTSISGELEKRETDEFLTMAGNIRDRDANVAVLFEARMIDLDSLTKVESVMECVTRIDRLSDGVDDSRCLSEETIVHSRSSELEEAIGQRDGEMIVSSMIERIVPNDQYVEPAGLTNLAATEHLLREIKTCLQGLLEPVASAVRNIYESFGNAVVESSFTTHGEASEHYTVELNENVSEHPIADLIMEVPDNTNKVDVVGEQCSPLHIPPKSNLEESIRELLTLFHDANERLGMIDSDVTAIRNQVQQLMAEQRQQGPAGTKSIGDAGQRSRRRSSVGSPKKPKQSQPIRCPVQHNQSMFGQSAQYCPTEIYSCLPVIPSVLVIHWTVDEDMLHCIVGFEIHVDGELRAVCFSNKRRTALIGNIDLRKHHQIALHATPDSICMGIVQWAPSFFLYHT